MDAVRRGSNLGAFGASLAASRDSGRQSSAPRWSCRVFYSTIVENLRLARPGASDDDLREALARAHLLDWVDGLPDGLGTFVGEPIEHLDEATATELTTDLPAAAVGRTVIFITHHLALTAAAARGEQGHLQAARSSVLTQGSSTDDVQA